MKKYYISGYNDGLGIAMLVLRYSIIKTVWEYRSVIFFEYEIKRRKSKNRNNKTGRNSGRGKTAIFIDINLKFQFFPIIEEGRIYYYGVKINKSMYNTDIKLYLYY